MGQRLIFVLGQVLVLALALLPGAGIGWLAWWLFQMAVGPLWAVPFAAVRPRWSWLRIAPSRSGR